MGTGNEPTGSRATAYGAESMRDAASVTSLKAAIAQLRQIGLSPFQSFEDDPSTLATYIHERNAAFARLYKQVLIPLFQADPESIVAMIYGPTNEWAEYSFDDAIHGRCDYSYDKVVSRPALVHTKVDPFICALTESLKDYVEQGNRKLASIRLAVRERLGIDEGDELSDEPQGAPAANETLLWGQCCYTHEIDEAVRCSIGHEDFEDLSHLLITLNSNGLGNSGWMAVNLDAILNGDQQLEIISRWDEATCSAIKESEQERAIVDSLRLAGVSAHLLRGLYDQTRDGPTLAEIVQEVNNVARYQQMLRAAHTEADVLSDLRKSRKAQRSQLVAAGCSESIFFAHVVRDKGTWDEGGPVRLSDLAKEATIINRCMGLTPPSSKVEDTLVRFAISLPAKEWKLTTAIDASGENILAWRNEHAADGSPHSGLEVRVSLAKPLSHEVKAVELCTLEADGNEMKHGEVIADCFETRALYQLLAYFYNKTSAA